MIFCYILAVIDLKNDHPEFSVLLTDRSVIGDISILWCEI